MTSEFAIRPRPDFIQSVTTLPLRGQMLKLLISPRMTVRGAMTYEATLIEIRRIPGGDATQAITRWESTGFSSRETAIDTAMAIWTNWQSNDLAA